MRRTIVLKNTATGQALTLPVTPKSYPMEAGRLVERLDMAVTGQIALPGLRGLFVGTLEFFLPARSYPFINSGEAAQPSYYIGLLTSWAQSAAVCRYIVTGTDVNAAVLLGMVEYGESDGTNDVQVKLPLYEYRYIVTAQIVKVTQNAKRPAESTAKPGAGAGARASAGKYTVKAGDSLHTIAKAVYGDESKAWQLATANGIKNPFIIHEGQTISLPTSKDLAGYAAAETPDLVHITPKAKSKAEFLESVSFENMLSATNARNLARGSLFLPELPAKK